MLRLSLYTGVDQVAGYEGKRYALLLGPVVLACVGPMDAQSTAVLPVPAEDPAAWLVPKPGAPLTYGVKGAPLHEFRPLWTVSDGQPFTTYPILADK